MTAHSPDSVATGEVDAAPLPFCNVVRLGDINIIQARLSDAVDPSGNWPRDSDGHTPLHWAAMSESNSILKLVLSKAGQRRHVDVTSEARPQRGQTPLHWACVAGHVRNVQTLLEHGADPHVMDGKGYNAATHAVQYGRVDLLYILLRAYPGLVNATDFEGHTLLQWAAYYDHHPAVRFLLMVHGVDPNVADALGMTPLHRAAQRDKPFVASALLQVGADLELKNEKNKTPMQLARPETRTAGVLMAWKEGVLTRDQPVPRRKTIWKFRFVLLYYVLAILSYGVYHTHIIKAMPIGIVRNAVFHVCCIIAFVAHSISTYSDPGEVKKGTIDDFVEYIKEAISNNSSERSLMPSAYCFTCFAERPPRSKHSSERDSCVKRFDHECPWVNNSVGLYTHKALLILIVSNIISEWIFAAAMVLSISRSPAVTSPVTAIIERPLSCILVVVQLMISGFCVTLLVNHVRLILRGRTTYEHMVAARHKRTNNPFDKGMWRNLMSFITSTGPGTGKALSSISVSSLKEVVLSTGDEGRVLIGKTGTNGNSESEP